jgi:aminoglycoside phosphotransferase (APT) family kinase protein
MEGGQSLGDSDTAAVRRGEALDIAALTEHLRGKIEGVERGIAVEQFPHGHSNLTYLLKMGGRDYVLRRAPLGPVAPKAHDMAREFRMLKAVHAHFSQAPEVYLLCEDPAVLGAVFFLMERRRGTILRDDVPPEVAEVHDHPRLVSEAFIDCLVRLHAVDVSAPDLAALGKPQGFLERQVRGWAERWNRAKTEELPAMDGVIEWLAERLPSSAAPALVHNDYKLDNVMFRAGSLDGVEAVLDWEMTTIGDPLADVGLALCYWAWADSPQMGEWRFPAVTSRAGWYTRGQFVQRYAERTGRDMTSIGYYEVLGIFKMAVILQQIYYRFHRGQTQDARFSNFDKRVKATAALAASLVERQK